jgi:hypothetical protein
VHYIPTSQETCQSKPSPENVSRKSEAFMPMMNTLFDIRGMNTDTGMPVSEQVQ